MATESKESRHPDAPQDPVEALTDDLIREFFTEAGQSTKSAGLGSGAMAALLEAAMGSPSRRASGTPILERVLLAQAIASELADSLAPALAEALAPEIMKALEHYRSDESSRQEPVGATRARRSETK
jgi:hypothetical protein